MIFHDFGLYSERLILLMDIYLFLHLKGEHPVHASGKMLVRH